MFLRICCFLYFISFQVFGQQHTKCDFGIEALGGVTQYGWVGQIGAVKYVSDKLFVKIDGLYSKEESRSIGHTVVGGDVSVGYSFLNINNFYLSGLLGATYSKENDREGLDRNLNVQKYGGLLGMEAEMYLSKKISLIGHYDYRLVSKDKHNVWGVKRWYGTAGIRYHLYGKKCNDQVTSNSEARQSYSKSTKSTGASSSDQARHSSCDMAIEALGGMTQFGWAAQLGVVKYLSDKLFVKIDGLYSKEESRSIGHTVVGGDVSVGYSFLNINNFYLSGLLGATYSKENDRKGLDRNLNVQKYGGLIGAEAEMYLSDQFSLVGHYDYRLVSKDKYNVWGVQRWYGMVGVRYHLFGNRCGDGGSKSRGSRRKPMSLYNSMERH